jgi:hypothetical protein
MWRLSSAGIWYWMFKLDPEFTAVVTDDSSEHRIDFVDGNAIQIRSLPTHYKVSCLSTAQTFQMPIVWLLELSYAKSVAIEFAINCREALKLAAADSKSLPGNA